MSSRLTIYTDGGADPNPGPGGWGAVVIDDATGERRELSGGDAKTTNNRMELAAAIGALEAVPPATPVRLVTDSIYLKKGITEWLRRWVANGWRRRGGAPVQNEDLWRHLAGLVAGRTIEWGWVKGHSGHQHNERADALATAEIRRRQGRGRRPAVAPRSAPSDQPSPDAHVHLRVSGPPVASWAAHITTEDGEERELVDTEPGASAPRLEILAAIACLEALPSQTVVAVHGASDYLCRGATGWLAGWQSSGWRTRSGGEVKNRDAWERLAAVLEDREVLWESADPAVDKRLRQLLQNRRS